MRNSLLSLMLYLDRIRIIHGLYKLIYILTIRLVTSILRRYAGVHCIYLRRGLAKDEWMPCLSDIDLTVIMEDGFSLKKVDGALKHLNQVIPFLEKQSQAISVGKFLSLTDEEAFPENKSFLYRIYEGKTTWKALYSHTPDHPLLSIPEADEVRTKALALSEALFWHGIAISEATTYQMKSEKGLGYFDKRRLCWALMKATTEMTNLRNFFENPGDLRFRKADVIDAAIPELHNTEWMGLMETNRQILRNEFDVGRAEVYLKEAFGYLSHIYAVFFQALLSAIKSDWAFVRWCRTHGNVSSCGARHVMHDVRVGRADIGGIRPSDRISAIFLTPQPKSGGEVKILLLVVLENLRTPFSEGVSACESRIKKGLERDGIKACDIETNLVDRFGFLTFSAPHQFGLPTRCVYSKYAAHGPSLYQMIFDDTLQREQCLSVAENFETPFKQENLEG